MSDMHSILIFVLFIFLPAEVYLVRNEVRCGSVDIRNDPRMAFHSKNIKSNEMRYKECTILEGDFTISMITKNNVTNEMYPVFENLREITGSVLVFQIRGLESLGRMFPNLRVIGGHSLIMNYALVVYQNIDLRDIGLTKLVIIKNGGIRITENPKLCYAQGINWKRILVGKVRDIMIDQVAGHCKNDCPEVNDIDHCYKQPITDQISCWNYTHCQRICLNGEKIDSGCTDDDQPCQEECIGGCTRPGDIGACFSCRNLDWKGLCVEKCPANLFEHLGRRCLTKEECVSLHAVTTNPNMHEKSNWKAFGTHCSYECPNGFKEDPLDKHSCIKCQGYCPKKCTGGETVDSISSALKYSKCDMIEGFLEIDMRIGLESTSAEKFNEAFGEIEEITGYLLIRFSSAFMSLHMFKKLRKIHGKLLWKNMYALIVFENQNLRQLFNIENGQKIEVIKGKVGFQNNRMLCYNKIVDFVHHLSWKVCDTCEVTQNDVSPYSNGDKAICDVIPLEIKIVSAYTFGFVVSWTPFNTTDMDHRKFLGYQIFYKSVKKPNSTTIDDDRSACFDSWNMQFETDEGDIESTKNDQLTGNKTDDKQLKGAIVTQGVEANTWYAVYVQTRLVNHPGAKTAISEILYVKTLFSTPGPPRIKTSEALSSSSIKLTWDIPLKTFGDITHYIVSWNLAIEYNIAKQNDVCDKRINPVAIPTKTLLSSSQSHDTCSKNGCCKCKEPVTNLNGNNKIGDINILDAEKRKESSNFEDILQNSVFVQNCEVNYDPNHCNNHATSANKQTNTQFDTSFSPQKRTRRHQNFPLELNALAYIPTKNNYQGQPALYPSKANRMRRAIGFEKKTNQLVSEFSLTTYYNKTELNVSDVLLRDQGHFNFTQGKINITGTMLILSGLPHFSEYHITIFACQNITAPENSCTNRPAWTSARTLPIPEKDLIDPSTVTVISSNLTKTKPNEKRIYWEAPMSPNGFIFAYRAKLLKKDGSTPLELCIPKEKFENDSGILFSGLSDGLYTLEIRVESSALTSGNYHQNYTIIRDLFEIRTPSFFTTKSILIIGLSTLALLIIIGITLYYFVNRMFGKKVEEYWRQTISANPEYLSQMELYKADEWELKRSDIILEQEIGRGTFGKVFRGIGKSVRSINGQLFGDCAIKTVPETASNGERLHFLIEASVMKQFNTSFIVKLYGVVSDGQPVLVVMELMEKGNLRDFLRSHRPGAEENKENRPLPTADQYFNWAAQIADGMAYLESLKFCHRDLAARNCMVHANESVKIGDFGMARDIYYHEYYKPTGKRLMPVRWMAPESLKDGKFTLKSDVWSYGIVLYEMLTLGQQPYAGLGNDQVFNYTGVQRHVLNRPTGCPDFWYGLMLLCWKYDPRERPSFKQIVRYLEDYSSEEFIKASFVLNEKTVEQKPESYNFNIDLDGEILKRNDICDEFIYGQNEVEDDADLAEFASEDEFQKPICLNNRREDERDSNIEGIIGNVVD